MAIGLNPMLGDNDDSLSVLSGLDMRFFILVFLLIFGLFPAISYGQYVIQSSVSKEFINGLQVKYLKNIAKHMNMEIEIIPMPFARRIRELREGNLDLLVGLRRVDGEQDEVVYIKPSYETLRHTFFVRKSDENQLLSFTDLRKLNIGVTRNAKYFERFNQETDLVMVPVSTLLQKIELLKKGRIDTFIHFQESALPRINDMGLQNDIVLAQYQPIEVNNYYVTISQNSPLFKHKHLVEAAVRKAIKDDEFATIRREHYLSQARQN
ncbi:amino acid ABC transporter substrate-binding protein, PAAT family [Paraglaciecola sp. T6c]|uniref:substrate-binding periplasmic protein n=1 Tax=Pseudoalteromonas atlantica (strain T6c / ATCC BAA-1087) TaxID=3042615 RepID=UPI00005C52E0|nr:transporter substrate-binding domain-containing protein [Paraglaciecola sp. T6c]ABG41056.1 amino acid ABC transporter substrate-binding protein, PAAT family [Paraglaciecola sp. T6c]